MKASRHLLYSSLVAADRGSSLKYSTTVGSLTSSQYFGVARASVPPPPKDSCNLVNWSVVGTSVFSIWNQPWLRFQP